MKKILFFVGLGISLLIIIHLVSSIYTLWHKQDVLISAQKELGKEQKENSDLKKQLKVVSNPSFLEEEARNKLFMVKPGEGEVMIAQDMLAPTPPPKAIKDTRPNWQQWIAVFFH